MACNILGTAKVVLIALVLSLGISCASSAPTAKPVTVGTLPGHSPVILDIIGVREWEPAQNGTLICGIEDTGNLKYSWSAEGGKITGESKQVSWTAPDAPGDYAISITVTNAEGQQATFRKSFKVTTNPYNNDTADMTIYLKFTLPSDMVVKEKRRLRIWTTAEIECVVEGANESDLTYKWSAPVGKLAGNGLSEGKARKIGWISPGVADHYKVSVTVTDKAGNTASGEVDFDVFCCRE